MTRFPPTLAAVVLTCSLAVACGGGDDEDSATPPLLNLGDTLLTADELPAGWTVGDATGWWSEWEDWVEGEPYDVCGGVEIAVPAEAIDSALGVYTREEAGASAALVLHETASFPEGKGKDVMSFYAEAADKCDGVTETLEDGTELIYRFTSLSFPELGDETFAFQWQIVYGGDGEAEEPGAYVLVRQNDLVSALTMPSDLDTEALEQIAPLAYEKLKGLQ